ncbi:MAG: hypothetical protein KKB30_11780 [Proteobacteria bacterium]|nr:hypothetical protein [Pseudomonadota bacterium]MBU1714393.1 hypothetical protein [Pseudomonadota bacterium]
MTLFTKTDCRLCDQLKNRFDFAAMQVDIEVLDNGDAAALAHLAWHSLVESARKTLPLLVLDDSSTEADFNRIEGYLIDKAMQCGLTIKAIPSQSISCDDGSCSIQ